MKIVLISNRRSEVKKLEKFYGIFSSDIKAVKTAKITKILEKTINKITKNIRIWLKIT